MMVTGTLVPGVVMTVVVMGVIMIVVVIMVKIDGHIAEQQVAMLAAMRVHVLDVGHCAGDGRLDKHQHQGRAQHGASPLQQEIRAVLHCGRLARRYGNWQRTLTAMAEPVSVAKLRLGPVILDC
jgi:hypothetical protein